MCRQIVEKSEEAKKRAKKYFWAIDDDNVLDPTNSDGVVELELKHLFGLVKISTTLCRINEPSLGSDCNVYTKISGGNVQLIAERDLFAGGEDIFYTCLPSHKYLFLAFDSNCCLFLCRGAVCGLWR